MKFDVLLASYGRANLLEKCLESLFNAAEKFDFIVYVLTQGQDLETIDKVKNFSNKLRIETILVEEKLTPGASRNKLIEISKSDFIFCLDDDAYLPRNYFYEVQKILTLNVDILGGPDLATNENQYQTIMGYVLASPWVMGPTFRRHSSLAEKLKENASEVDLTLCNLWLRRSKIDELGVKFNESIPRCEENIFIEALISKGAKAFFSSQIPVFHHRRISIIKIANIQFKSGHSRGIVMTKLGHKEKKFFYIPLIVGFGIVVLPYIPFLISKGLILIHTFIAFMISFDIVLKTKFLKAFFWSWFYIVTIHTFFSVGMLFGYAKGQLLKWK